MSSRPAAPRAAASRPRSSPRPRAGSRASGRLFFCFVIVFSFSPTLAAPKLCACQRENEYAQCMAEISAECASLGEYASSQPMCQTYVAQGGVLDPNGALDPMTFMAVIKASASMCKHPYLFTVAEMTSFLGATGFTSAQTDFTNAAITGAHMTKLTLEQLTGELNMPLGQAMDFADGKVNFLSPGALVNAGKIRGRDVQHMQMAFNVKSVSEIDEVKFEFKAEVDVLMHWSDANLWGDCNAGGDAIDEGTCAYVWRPQLIFLNARELEHKTADQFLWSDVRTKTVTFQMAVRGTFSAPMSFRTFPADEQRLPVTVSVVDGGEGNYLYSAFRFQPVSAQLDARVASPSEGKDIISGWTLAEAAATEHPTIILNWNTLSGTEGPMREYLDGMVTYYRDAMGVEMDIEESSTTSAVTCDIVVRRTTVFYMINYILVVVLLTSLSWVVFIMDRADLAGRAGMSLTLLLALNVFQLILSELMPKTGYLTPMHEFVIVSTFFTVAAAFESVVVKELDARSQKLAGRVEAEEEEEERERTAARERRRGEAEAAGSLTSDTPPGSLPKLGSDSGDLALDLRLAGEDAEETAGDQKAALERSARMLKAAKMIDRVSLVGFPIVYAAYTAYVFGPTRGG